METSVPPPPRAVTLVCAAVDAEALAMDRRSEVLRRTKCPNVQVVESGRKRSFHLL